MQNKYYTPDLEDLRIGYEFEFYQGYSSESDYKPNTENEKEEYWKKDIFTKDDALSHNDYNAGYFAELIKDTERGYIRVPYLTKEQIEKEGWQYPFTIDISILDRIELVKDIDNDRIILRYNIENKNLILQQKYHKDTPILFNGFCKSINEFRTIMKLLKIN